MKKKNHENTCIENKVELFYQKLRLSDTVQQGMLLIERLPVNCLFNVSSVGVGPGIECFPDYFVGNKANKDLAVYFLKVGFAGKRKSLLSNQY